MSNLLDKLQSFAANGGRFAATQEPKWGEPFYENYMNHVLQRDYAPGDKVRICIKYPNSGASKTYESATILRFGYNLEILKQGKTVWKDRKNIEHFWYGYVASIELIKKNPDFDIANVDPQGEKWRQEAKKDDVPDSWEIKHREELKQQCSILYPDASFEKSVILAIDTHICFPWYFEKAEAELYVSVPKKNVIHVPVKTGSPWPNKYNIGAYNCSEPYGENAIAMLPADDYSGAMISCRWKIYDGEKTYHFIQMGELTTFEMPRKKANVYCINMSVTPINVLNRDYESNQYSFYESFMDAAAVFKLYPKEDSLLSIRNTVHEDVFTKWIFNANLAFHKYDMKSVLEDLCDGDDDSINCEVWVTQFDATPVCVNNRPNTGREYEWEPFT